MRLLGFLSAQVFEPRTKYMSRMSPGRFRQANISGLINEEGRLRSDPGR